MGRGTGGWRWMRMEAEAPFLEVLVLGQWRHTLHPQSLTQFQFSLLLCGPHLQASCPALLRGLPLTLQGPP